MTEQTDNRKISLAIPTRNKFDVLLASFKNVIDDERIEEITIVDDFSDEIWWWKLTDWLEFDAPENGKIKLCQNEMTLGTSLNKQRAVIFADSEYIIILNPNGILNKSDLDEIYKHEWSEGTESQFLFGTFTHREAWLRKFDEEQKIKS